MSREDFANRWATEENIYEAWGWHVTNAISEALKPVVAPQSLEYFLKVPSKPRCKDLQKLIVKAFFRGKNYENPYDQITDKVGTRFVVLLGTDVARVAQAVEGMEGWTWSKDRDYEEEQKRNPIAFDYAAVHYVVRSRLPVQTDRLLIPADIPCEVQIKTLLQHAYSELTHDTIYKPQIQATTTMKRNAAKAMALLEATNDYFEQVATDVRQALSSVRAITERLSRIYENATGLEASPSLLEGLLLEAYETRVDEALEQRLNDMLQEHPHLITRIQDQVAQRNPLFSQPSVLLAYLDIARRGDRAVRDWPLTPAEMEPLLNDLGESRF